MELCWVTLRPADIERSLHFYHRILGLPVSMHHRNGETEVVMLGSPDLPKVELLHDGQGVQIGRSEGISIGLQVEDLDQVMARLEDLGIACRGPVSPAPHLRFCFLDDPDGVTVQLVEITVRNT